MEKKRVVFFGSIGIARKILEEIVMQREIELIGVCCVELQNTWRTDESVYSFCMRNGIRILSHADIIAEKPDLGISVRYNKIIKQDVIDSFSLGIVNTHGGILPEYRGSYCNINAIINGEKEYGATLHYIDKGVDTGDIIDIKKCAIMENDTGFSLYLKSEELCYELINDNIDSLLTGTNSRVPQDEYIANGHYCQEYKAKSTLSLKELAQEEVFTDRGVRIIRAFDSKEHEPAYTVVRGMKVFLRVTF